MALVVMLPQALGTADSPTFTNLTLSGDLRVDGGDIGLTTDTDLIQLAANLVSVNGDIALRGQRFQFFRIDIANNAGTIQHRIGTPAMQSSNLTSRITGPSTTYAATPSDNFNNGAGFLVGDASILIFDVAAQTAADGISIAVVVERPSATNVTAFAVIGSRTVNGVSRVRLELQFVDSEASTSFALNTTNIPSGRRVSVWVLATLA
jgi:hypothetical protein